MGFVNWLTPHHHTKYRPIRQPSCIVVIETFMFTCFDTRNNLISTIEWFKISYLHIANWQFVEICAIVELPKTHGQLSFVQQMQNADENFKSYALHKKFCKIHMIWNWSYDIMISTLYAIHTYDHNTMIVRWKSTNIKSPPCKRILLLVSSTNCVMPSLIHSFFFFLQLAMPGKKRS